MNKKFIFEFSEHFHYTVPIEAKTEEDAKTIANELINGGEYQDLSIHESSSDSIDSIREDK